MSISKNGKQWRVSYKYNGKLYHESYRTQAMAYTRDMDIKAAKAEGAFKSPHELLASKGGL